MEWRLVARRSVLLICDHTVEIASRVERACFYCRQMTNKLCVFSSGLIGIVASVEPNGPMFYLPQDSSPSLNALRNPKPWTSVDRISG